MSPGRKAEGNVTDTQHTVQAQFPVNPFHGPESFHGLILLGRHGEGQTVDENIFPGNAVRTAGLENIPGDPDPVFRRLRQSLFIHGQTHNRCAVFLHNRQNPVLLLFLPVYGVHDAPAVQHPESRFHGLRIRGINLQRKVRHALDRLHYFRHQFRFRKSRHTYIDIQNVGTRFLLLNRQLRHIVHIPASESLLEPLLAGRIDPLADHIYPAVQDSDL